MSDSTRPWVILLSGSSSAGKTSLARALQRQVADPAWLFVADECFPKSPRNANDATHQHGDANEGLDLVYTVDTTGHPPAECATDLLEQLEAATGCPWS